MTPPTVPLPISAQTSLNDVAVVIPTLDAAATLALTLATLPPSMAVVVSDGGSSDDTVRIAADRGSVVVTGPRGRGNQMVVGARAADRSWLLFLHADTQMNPEACAAVERHVGNPSSTKYAATFALIIDDPAWQARAIERAVACRVQWLGLPYGDQGLLIHRDLYRAIGGFRDLPLMEDVDIARRLGRRRIIPLKASVSTSAARWRKRGWVRQTALNLTCVSLFLIGVDARWVARLYDR